MKIEMNVTLMPFLSMVGMLIVLTLCAYQVYRKFKSPTDLQLSIGIGMVTILSLTMYWQISVGKIQFWSRPYMTALLCVLLIVILISLYVDKRSFKDCLPMIALGTLNILSYVIGSSLGGFVIALAMLGYAVSILLSNKQNLTLMDKVQAWLLVVIGILILLGHVTKMDAFHFLYSLAVVSWLALAASKYFERILALLRQAGISSFVDPLTKLNNKGFLMMKVDKMLEQNNVSVIFVDIDNFKQLNDTKGHDFGDQVLIQVAKVFKEVVKQNGVVCRFGGEEMVALIGNDQAVILAEKLCSEVRKNTGVTVSVGVAHSGEVEADGRDLGLATIKKADLRMYAAKKSGKNRVVFNDNDYVFVPNEEK